MWFCQTTFSCLKYDMWPLAHWMAHALDVSYLTSSSSSNVSSQNPDTSTMSTPGVCLNILEARNKQNGCGSATNPEKFFQQDYQQLKQYCASHGVRYIDERFPPDKISIGNGLLSPSDLENVVWRRPGVSLTGGFVYHMVHITSGTSNSVSAFSFNLTDVLDWRLHVLFVFQELYKY